MNKNAHFNVCLSRLAGLKDQILGSDVAVGHLKQSASHSRRKIYSTVDFLWLNIVLTAIGYIHIREKRNYLEQLSTINSGKALTNFYKLIGIPDFSTKLPSIGFFCEYVNYFEQEELERIQNRALKQIQFVQSEFNLVSIDGKDIRHCSGKNVKSVNVVVNHALRGSYIVDSEQTWVKKS